ncbi:hypothetical protein FB03_08700 [Actinotignum schaalii]|nr:hypothetical protein FB03_08700 [Actinotignum schaalii]
MLLLERRGCFVVIGINLRSQGAIFDSFPWNFKEKSAGFGANFRGRGGNIPKGFLTGFSRGFWGATCAYTRTFSYAFRTPSAHLSRAFPRHGAGGHIL